MSNVNALTALPSGSMDAYISAAFQLPMLSAEEEKSLAIRLRDQKDLQAAQTLITSHIRFVVRIARNYSGYGLALPDLIQEGTVGLMKAVKRFDPDMGVRLVSFAVHWIKAEIHEYILKNWRIVKVATTKAQRKLFFNLRSSKKRLGWFSKQEVDDVAQDLGVKPETVLEMESRLSGQDIAFDGPMQDDDDKVTATPAGYLSDMRMEPAHLLESSDSESQMKQQLIGAMQNLDERSREILEARWLGEKKSTLHELADRFQVSAERIRQIEKNAMNKLKTQLA
ncbi:RNA polymerase sigma factor RpoH [Candidatus Thiodiazotropha sp. CDECU1]|uniref:RNA polymerase sigma factor RpoH n=1 Tax=Candidatus Thiodiazotropha sp. CDECU1 TaxID=3065865 RepID=UPI00292F1502|nr:RNA polymerase sigma factor RpoH [Candidatus Thiodiazotropha sp. CDECU1]